MPRLWVKRFIRELALEGRERRFLFQKKFCSLCGLSKVRYFVLFFKKLRFQQDTQGFLLSFFDTKRRIIHAF